MSPSGRESEQGTQHFTGKNLEAIETSEKEQVQLREWVTMSKGFSDGEKAALRVDSSDAFNSFWQRTENAKEEFDRSHEKGSGALGRRYQSAASLILPFMEDFSPIVQIVKDFGAPYGGLAVGTISLLFAVSASLLCLIMQNFKLTADKVAENKNAMEKSLGSTISSIRDRLPGLKLYQHIYNGNHELDIALQSQIALSYRAFMDFSMASVKYYKAGGRRRWLRALLPINQFADKAAEVQGHIVRVRLLSEELLNKNVDTIKRSNDKLEQDNIELKARIAELQKGHDHDRLNEVQWYLNLDNFSEEEHRRDWNRHVSAVQTDEDLNSEQLEQMCGPKLDAFRAQQDYQTWMNSERPCMLIFSGYNDDSIDRAYQFWLSPVAAATVQTFDQQKPRPFYAYYAMTQNGKLLYDVFSVILLQLLRQKSSALRDEQRYAELRTELGKSREADKAEKDRVIAMEKAALRAIDLFDESETAYIIVDRADRCRDLKRAADHRKVLLKGFVKMVEAARCKLKILVVVDGRSWPVKKYQDELGAKMQERLIVCTANQRMRDQ